MDTQPQKKSIPPEKLTMIGIIAGLVLALIFIIIGSMFFGLKAGPSNSSTTIDSSQYRPSDQ